MFVTGGSAAAAPRRRLSANEYRQANQGLTLQFLVSFAEFMEKGPFRFGWDS